MCHIDFNQVQIRTGDRIILFGAGYGSELLINYLREKGRINSVIFIVDNDASMWGKNLCDVKICPPDSLMRTDFDKIYVTSISGEQAISKQLEEYGFEQGRDFFLVARYGDAENCVATVITYRKWLEEEKYPFKGKSILTVGPGGFLGIECLLYCLGADKVCSVDKFEFSMSYPEVTSRWEEYVKIRDFLLNNANFFGFAPDFVLSRFDSLFKNKDNKIIIDSNRIDFRFPACITHIPFEDNTFNLSFSSAVLEHVEAPDTAVKEMFRVLVPGGKTGNTIITRDHRSFSNVRGYTPFSFREYSSGDWHNLVSRKFYQNRLMPIDWKTLFLKEGFGLCHLGIKEQHPLSDEEINRFDSTFRCYSKEELGELDCDLVGCKPN